MRITNQELRDSSEEELKQKYSVRDLKAEAKERGIPNSRNMTEDNLVTALKELASMEAITVDEPVVETIVEPVEVVEVVDSTDVEPVEVVDSTDVEPVEVVDSTDGLIVKPADPPVEVETDDEKLVEEDDGYRLKIDMSFVVEGESVKFKAGSKVPEGRKVPKIYLKQL